MREGADKPGGNVYDDPVRAAAYDRLEFPGTYYLAFRDLPALLATHAPGPRALDFGCGAGRSSRFLKRLGYTVVGADIARPMLNHARERDPEGDYRLVADGDLSALAGATFDVVLSAFTFDNVTAERKRRLLKQLASLLVPGGALVNVVSSPELYLHEWVSFSTRDFPENARARSGDRVRIVMLDVPDQRPVEDEFCAEATYQAMFAAAGLDCVQVHRPLGLLTEPFPWVTETTISPWTIHVLRARR